MMSYRSGYEQIRTTAWHLILKLFWYNVVLNLRINLRESQIISQSTTQFYTWFVNASQKIKLTQLSFDF